MKIKTLEYIDIPQLAELYKYFWNENSDINKMEKTFNQIKNNNSYILLCAVEHNKLCGAVMGIICEELYGNCNPFLVVENMIVDVNHRREGIGIKLFTEL